MRSIRRHTAIFALLLLSLLRAGAEGFVTLDNILSSRKVYQVTQDSDGFIWMFTQNGVDRYDGNAVKTYRLEDAPQSRDQILSSTKFFLDAGGSLQIAVKNGTVYRYDRELDTFLLTVDLRDIYPGISLFCAYALKDGTTLLGTSHGVLRFGNGDITACYLEKQSVTTITEDDGGRIYLGTNEAVYCLDDSAVSTLCSPVNASSLLYCDGDLFIGTSSDGLKVMGGDGRLRDYGQLSIKVPIRKMLKDTENHLVAGSDGDGVFIFDLSSGRLAEHCLAEDSAPSSLSGNTVSDLCLDNLGNLWVATTTDWVCHQNKGAPHIERYHHQPGNPNSLSSNHVNVIYEDNSGSVWFGTNDSVCKFDAQTQTWTAYPMPTPGVVLAMTRDSEGELWVGGYGFPLFRINPKNKACTVFRDGKYNYVYSLISEKDNVWIGGLDEELIRYNIKEDALSSFPINNVGDIKDLHGGMLGLATSAGMSLLDTSTGEMREFTSFGQDGVKSAVRCLAGDGKAFWMGTDGAGLISYDTERDEYKFFTTSTGLSSNSITSVVMDSTGNLWFTTSDVLYRIDSTGGSPANMNSFIGVDRGYFNPNSSCRLSDGRIMLGTADGAILFNPADFKMNKPEKITPVIFDFTILDTSADGEESSVTNVNLSDRIKLKSSHNSFSFVISALDFQSQYRLKFSSQLSGYDKAPRLFESSSRIDYYNIPSGRYTYILKVMDKFTGDTLGEKRIGIVIKTPALLSWWAKVIYLAIISAFIFLVVAWFRRRSYNKVMAEKINTFVNFAHDLKTPITLIKTPLNELEQRDDVPEQIRSTIATANRNSDKLMSMINRLLDIRKNDTSWESIRLTDVDCSDYLESTLSEFIYSARKKGIDLSYDVSPELTTIWIDREKMDLIINNILSNSVKYTENGFIRVTAVSDRKNWSLIIKDTGIGIPADFQSKLFRGSYRADNAKECDEYGYGIGMMITRQLVHQHHGTISFSSTCGGESSGTTFTVSFPKQYKASASVIFEEESAKAATEDAFKEEERENGDRRNCIMVVEDDGDTLAYIRSSLESEFTVCTAPDGRSALDVICEKNPDIVISDVLMPIMNGYDLCRNIKSDISTSHIPVLLLTGMTDRESVIRGLESGADDYIIKPFDMAVLKARLKNILSERQRLREAFLYSNTATARNEYSNKLDQEFIDKVVSVVQKELANPEFQIVDLCRELAMSRTAFYNKLKSLTGQGPNDFIRNFRLEKSKDYLAEHRYSIAEVSDMVGFSDAKYFSICFKKQFGISPSKF